MPRCHEIPRSVTQCWSTMNWKPDMWVLNEHRSQMVTAPVPAEKRRATRRWSSTRPRGMRETTTAPTNGRRMAIVRGELAMDVLAASAARVEVSIRGTPG